MKTLLSTAAAAALMGGAAIAQTTGADNGVSAGNTGDYGNDPMQYTEYLTQDDRMIDRDEFDEATRPEFDRFDTNNDGFIDNTEYERAEIADEAVFGDYDVDDDEALRYEEYSEKRFDDFDQNNDDMLTEGEMASYSDN